MQTRHLSNHPIRWVKYSKVWTGLLLSACFTSLIWFSSSAQQFIVGLLLLITITYAARWLIKQGTVAYTLTVTHFQQHFFKGGWVLQWKNISHIGICQYETQGWYQPLPWIGIKIKSYPPYLDSICPRITTELLLSQRSLLYVGLQQQQKITQFEDVVLDSTPYTSSDNRQYIGLQAMLANRMHYQRQYFDYDIFISTSDLDRPAEEFVGLMRRYLAASQSIDSNSNKKGRS